MRNVRGRQETIADIVCDVAGVGPFDVQGGMDASVAQAIAARVVGAPTGPNKAFYDAAETVLTGELMRWGMALWTARRLARRAAFEIMTFAPEKLMWCAAHEYPAARAAVPSAFGDSLSAADAAVLGLLRASVAGRAG